MKLTVDQRKAVEAKNNILVAASAGTGKTSTMIERVIHLILKENIDISEVLILIFNDANARELRIKLYDAITSKLAESQIAESKVGKQQLTRALSNLPYANIYTIHSFSSKVAREHFSELNISPSFSILSDEELKLREVISEVLDAGRESEYKEDLIDLIKIFTSRERTVDEFLQLFKLLSEQVSFKGSINEIENKTPEQFLNESIEIVLRYFNKAFERLSVWSKEAQQIINSHYMKKELLTSEEKKYINFAKSIYANFLNFKKLSTISELLNFEVEFEKDSKSNHECFGYDLIYAIREAYKVEFRDEIKKIREIYTCDIDTKLKSDVNGIIKYVKVILKVLIETYERYSKYKISNRLMTYSDLQTYCLKALEINTDYKKQFKYVFVDEYQDLNHIQEEIINRLTENKLFAVGDVKQSIYRFRFADPKIFIDRKKRYENSKENQIVYLKHNFRSSTKILDFVNRIFKTEMTENLSDVDYENEKFILVNNKINDDDVKCIICNKNDKNDEDVSLSTYIACQIKEYISQGYKYEDIVVLTRNNICADSLNIKYKILSVFDKFKIPYKTSSNEDNKIELIDLISFLNAINNPYKDIYLFSYFTSYFSKLTEKDMNIIKNATDARRNQELKQGNSINFTCLHDRLEFLTIMEDLKDNSNEYNEVAHHYLKIIKEKLKTLKDYRLLAASYSPKELIYKIISKFHYDSFLKSKGSNTYSILNSLIDLSSRFTSLSDFLNELEKSPIKSTKQSGNLNAVEFSTVHSYKGLEKPIVFASTIFKKKPQNTDDINLLGKELFSIKSTDSKTRKKYNNITCFAYKYLSKMYDFKDELRLLYVQLTRAKNLSNGTTSKLILIHNGEYENSLDSNSSTLFDKVKLSRVVPKKSLTIYPNQFCDIINNAISLSDLGIKYYKVDCIEDSEEAQDNKYVHLDIPKILKREIDNIQKFEYKFKDSIDAAIHYSVSDLSKDNNIDSLKKAYFKGIMNLGTVYHKVLQNIKFTLTTIEEVKSLLNTMVNSQILSKDERTQVDEKLILNIIKLPIIQENIRKGAILECEKRIFSTMKVCDVIEKNNCQDLTLVDGIIDLVIRGEENIIFDYKLSRPKDEDILDNYKKQLFLYKKIFEKEIGEKINKVGLIYINTGEIEFFD